MHAPEKPLNPAEIDQLQGRILALEIENARLKPSVATGTTLRREAETALAGGRGRYRILFNAIDKGFCIFEFFDGAHGPLADYVHVETNAACELSSRKIIISSGQLEPDMQVLTKPFVVETFVARVPEMIEARHDLQPAVIGRSCCLGHHRLHGPA